MCGEELTIPAAHPTKTQWCWPTCTTCDTVWRQHEGIPLFPRPRTSHASTRGGGRAVAHA
ncbi:zinc finger protein [Saccharothrix syringae]|uniref:zinc finger protein n=1 Tax=Saccharothrix syringae TaxID=103733 RepID=UPI0012F95227|nr:zinc finger protein [Saccharothrix syringae]